MANEEEREPFLLERSGEFVSYDDDEVESAVKRKRAKTRCRFWLVVSLAIVAVLSVGASFFVLSRHYKQTGTPDSPSASSSSSDVQSVLGRYRHAAIASDSKECSEIAKHILEKKGGSSVDAAIAIMICYSTVNPMSSGIAGGFFMTVYDSAKGKAYGIDARETAPGGATEDMYVDDPILSSEGGLSIAVPGEVKGYERAHKLFGKLPWKDLFLPSIDMANNGFRVSEHLAEAMKGDRQKINKDPDLKEAYTNPKTKELYREGDIIKLPKLGKTMEAIAEGGADAFYKGTLADDIVADLKEKGSIITKRDLETYDAKLVDPVNITLRDGSVLYSLPPPSSGAVLEFIMNIVDGYKMTPETLKMREEKLLAYHRITEAFKFAYAKRTDLGDAAFVDVNDIVKNLTSRTYADDIRSKIWDNTTHGTMYYGPTFYDRFTTSTAHLSVVGNDDLAVSVTTTVNLRFGSGVMGHRTGLVFNDEMDDFSSPNITNSFGIPPSPANFIKPGKRPLSSMCPVVMVNKDGKVKMVTGAAGGSRITTSTAFVMAKVLLFGDNIKQAIDFPRLHHQLLPPVLQYETDFPEYFVNGLRDKGHNVSEVSPGLSIVNGVVRVGEFLEANDDYRRPGGHPAGF